MANNDRKILRARMIIKEIESWVERYELGRNRARFLNERNPGSAQSDLDQDSEFLARAQADLARLERG